MSPGWRGGWVAHEDVLVLLCPLLNASAPPSKEDELAGGCTLVADECPELGTRPPGSWKQAGSCLLGIM